jgi:hypothetical protein
MDAAVSRLASRMAEEFQQVAAVARRETSEALNQASRRIRQSETEEDVYAALVDSARQFSERGVLLRLGDGRVTFHDADGVLWDVPLADAPAVAAAAASADPVVALCSASELSAPVAAALAEDSGRRARLFPVQWRGENRAVLTAISEETAALELLAAIAGSKLEPGLGVPATRPLADETVCPTTDLERPFPNGRRYGEANHLRAQRFARVQVAAIRLHKSQAVGEGRAARDLYARFRPEIDAARESFRLQFLKPGPAMPDYLHFELIHTLANRDSSLLGLDYPGPLTY